MPETSLKVRLITHTPLPEETCAAAAKLCYASVDTDELLRRISNTDQSRFLNRIMESGHLSVLEHASYTFAIEGVSRALLAQITRHRLASFSVQSQRYVSFSDSFRYIIPPSVKDLGEEAVQEYARQMDIMQSWYSEWQKKLGGKGEKSNEDARFVLPNACETRMIVTMNVRELLHFFELRCCERAQWEIRQLAFEMYRLCLATAPVLFRQAGPGCVRGHCPEGEKSCGKAKDVRERFQQCINMNVEVSKHE